MSTVIEHAHQLIRTLHQRLISFRKETYKTVHDDIGSTLSAASIKAKVLTDKIQDGYEKQQITEIHALIRETLEHVTTLNRKLKISWVPQGTPTLFEDIRKELTHIQSQYGIQLSLEVTNDKSLNKLNYSMLTLIYEWVTTYVHDSIERLAENLQIEVHVLEDRLEWTWKDSSPIAPSEERFQTLIEKTNLLRGNFSIQSKIPNLAVLTLPTKGDA
jgi:glucose-6-phosphate-specific signal transduction histidine kinase